MRAAPDRPVVVIDDDLQFIRMVERALKAEGIPVQAVTTPDVDEAAAIVARSGCRAALVDVYMYGETLGFTLIERLRGEASTAFVPLIVTSGARREIGRRVAFLQANGCGVLIKPFAIEELLGRLGELGSLSDPIVPSAEVVPLKASTDDMLKAVLPVALTEVNP